MAPTDEGVGTLTPATEEQLPLEELTPAQLRKRQQAREAAAPPPRPEPATEPIHTEPLTYDAQDAERAAQVTQMQEARDLIGVTEVVDPLQALLAAPVAPPESEWTCHRLKTTFRIRAITNKEYGEVQDQATRFTRNRRTGRMDKDLDATLMSLLTVVKGSISPDFTDIRFRQKYHVPTIHEAVAGALLPGEVDALAAKILKISGFDDELEEAGKD